MDMMFASAPDIEEDRLLNLYQMATSGEDPDKVEMGLIDGELRKAGVKLKRKEGSTAIGDGVASKEDIQEAGKTAKMAMTLFGDKLGGGPGVGAAAKLASKWKTLGSVFQVNKRAHSILKDLEDLQAAFTEGT